MSSDPSNIIRRRKYAKWLAGKIIKLQKKTFALYRHALAFTTTILLHFQNNPHPAAETTWMQICETVLSECRFTFLDLFFFTGKTDALKDALVKLGCDVTIK